MGGSVSVPHFAFIFSLIILSLSLVHAQQDSSCYAKVEAVKRADQNAAWMIEDTRYQIYDVIVTNEGRCALTSIKGLFEAYRLGFISEGWNYDIQSGRIFGYGTYLAVGQSFYGAGFVLANSTMPELVLTSTTCDSSCPSTTTSAPSTSAPSTSAPSTSAPSTSAPSTSAHTTSTPTTSAPTTSAPVETTSAPTTSTPLPNTCAVTAVVERDGYSWLDAGRNTSVYRLTITNNGPCALFEYRFSFVYSKGSLLSYWNIEPSRGGFLVTGYGNTLAIGSSYSAAGVIVADGPDVITVHKYGENCKC